MAKPISKRAAIQARVMVVSRRRGPAIFTFLAEGLHQPAAVLVIGENVLAPIPPVHHVVNRTGILQSQFAGHPFLAAILYRDLGRQSL
jgi:hypothetical protein